MLEFGLEFVVLGAVVERLLLVEAPDMGVTLTEIVFVFVLLIGLVMFVLLVVLVTFVLLIGLVMFVLLVVLVTFVLLFVLTLGVLVLVVFEAA
jgi:hypothetical protein